MSNLGDAAVEIAKAEYNLKQSERIDNRGERIDIYLKNAGRLSSDPDAIGPAWCGMFIYWCYSQAATQLNVLNPLPKATFGGKELKTWAEAHPDWIVYRAGDSEPTLEPGDIFVVANLSHVGMVIEPIEDTSIHHVTHLLY